MFEYTPVSAEVQEKQQMRDFPGYVKVLYNDPAPLLKDFNPEPCFVSERYKSYDKAIKDYPVYKDDIWIISYPKTGTTLMSELVTVLLSEMDFKKLEETPLLQRIPYLELGALTKEYKIDPFNMDKSLTRRVVKTHLPVNLLPTEMLTQSDHKIIYTVRNPKDAVVSVFHHFKNLHGYCGSLTDILDGYLKGEILYGSYFQHVEEYVRVAQLKKNLLFVTYEDMVTNMPKVVKEVAEFLEINLNESDIDKVAEYVHFDQMKARKSSNFQHLVENFNKTTEFKFLRKGKKDSHKEEMPAEYIEKFDEEMQKWKGVMELYGNN